MQLDLFKTLPKLAEEKLHPKYKLLRDNFTIMGAKEILLEWSDGFVDRDNKIVEEFQTSYHATFWELYIHAVLKEVGRVHMSHPRPDFLVESDTCPQFYVEATTANIKQGGRQECHRNIMDIFKILWEPIFRRPDFDEVMREAIIRHSNSFVVKSSKYCQSYRTLSHVNKDTPFVIALGGYEQIDYGQEAFYPMIALLYKSFYNPTVDSYCQKEFVLKDNNSPIQLGLFCDDTYKHVAAVVFSCVATHGKLCAMAVSQQKTLLLPQQILNIRHDYDFPHFKLQEVSVKVPETLTDGLFIFHNPYAENPLSDEVFKKTDAIQIHVKGKDLQFESNTLPIIARCNSAIPLPLNFFGALINQAYNPGYIVDSFFVYEIDERIDTPEMTLISYNGDYIRIVDLLPHELIELKTKGITKGDFVGVGLDSRNPMCVKLLHLDKISS